MRGIGACLLILLLLAGIAPAMAEDVEIKQLVPMFLKGTVYIGDTPAKPGITIESDILGFWGGSAVTMADGLYGSESKPMMVQAGANETLKGEPVTFWMNGVKAQETIL